MTRRGLLVTAASAGLLLARSDSAGDGTPDFLRLDDESDRRIFRRWFTFLAEAQYFQRPELRPVEIVDCAALIRYAYREALRTHDSPWAAAARLPIVAASDSIAKYRYPHTPLGATLFRVKEGPYRPADVGNGAFAQFADSRTIGRYNTHRVARGIQEARAGDLLFFRQESEHMPFHSMIYLGASQISRDQRRYVVYHTGPDAADSGADRGIIRRLTVEELLGYPEPQWRLARDNPRFLGIYQWNILRETA